MRDFTRKLSALAWIQYSVYYVYLVTEAEEVEAPMQETDFMQLMQANQGRLFRIAWAIVGREEDAHDILQETAERGWRCRMQLQGGAQAFPAWIKRIAVNRSINWLKKHRRELLVDPTSGGAWLNYSPVVVASDTLDLWDALRQLPFEQRQTLVLKCLADQTLPEIARALGTPLGTIKSRYARGLSAMRELLSSDSDTINDEVH